MHTLFGGKTEFALVQPLLKVVNGEVLVALKDDEIMAVALMIAEKQVFAVSTRQVGPVLTAYLDGRCCWVFGVRKLNVEFLESLIYLGLSYHDGNKKSFLRPLSVVAGSVGRFYRNKNVM